MTTTTKCLACRHDIDNHSVKGCLINQCACRLKPSQITTGGEKNTVQKRTPSRKPPGKKNATTGKKEDKDSLGFRKKDYPLILGIALLSLNVWAFNTNTTSSTGVMIALAIDALVVFLLYKKYWPKQAQSKAVKSKSLKAVKGKSSTTAKTRRTVKDNAQGNELGLFGIKKKHYPILAIAFAGIVTLSAIMNRTAPLIIGAIVVDLALAYWYYKGRGNK